MHTFNEKYGPWALVIGSAEGLGEAWSVALARRGLNLVMVDNQLNTMQQLSEKLQHEYMIDIHLVHADLKDPNTEDEIVKSIEGREIGLLVYNAAYSLVKPFLAHTAEELDIFIEVNTRAQLRLVHAFSRKLIADKRGGGVLLMSSLAGLIGMQLVTPYAATKAFAWNLAEALSHELKPNSIDVMACIAGATATPAYLKTRPQYGFFKPQVMKPIDVAESALKKMGKRNLYIPGFSNRLNYFILTRLLPRKLAAGLANKTMAKMYRNQLD